MSWASLTMERAAERKVRVMRSFLRLSAVVLAAVVVAQTAVTIMSPRETGPEPAVVSSREYFTPRQIDRAQEFRSPQLVLYGMTVAIELAVLIGLTRRARRRPGPTPAQRARVASVARRPVLAGAATGAAISLALTLATLPLAAVSRQRAIDVGLSTRSWIGWAQDVLLDAAIGAALAAIGGAVLVLVLRRFGRAWWAPGAAAVVAFAVVLTYLTPVVIEPLFNRFTPLPAGTTRTEVLDLAGRAGVQVGQVYVVDASKRTTGANAYVAGLGATKRVVLYDTLLRDFPPGQVRLVVAHELGHVHHSDVPRGLLWVAIVAPFGMLAVARLAERIGPDDWRARPATAVPAVALALALVVTATTTISNQLSRRVEARADFFSLQLTRDPKTLIAFQQRIARANVSNPDPPGWASFLLGTHPPTLERIGAAVAFEERRSVEPGQ